MQVILRERFDAEADLENTAKPMTVAAMIAKRSSKRLKADFSRFVVQSKNIFAFVIFSQWTAKR
jgi:hypothetical protein